MTRLICAADVLMLISAALLFTGIGAAGLWSTVITIGIAIVIADGATHGDGLRL